MMTDRTKIETLAKFCGIDIAGARKKLDKFNANVEIVPQTTASGFVESLKEIVNWNPYEDWNHWRQVEEKIMEDGKLYSDFREKFLAQQGMPIPVLWYYMEADLPTRCNALLSLLNDA